jgi:glycine/D-amino acid oxidase-like deaminating enzyme
MIAGGRERTEWVIVGGGFAGLATAQGLGAAGAGPGVVLEREPLCGTHASGRNAGMLRLADDDAAIRAMARRTLHLLTSSRGHTAPRFQRTGGLTLAGGADAPMLVERATAMRREGTAVELLTMVRARRRFPELQHFRADLVLWCPDEGVVDIHALLTEYRQLARAQAFVVRTRHTVDELVVEAGRVVGVRLGDREIRATGVIDASGAWACQLGVCRESLVRLHPFRRHLLVTGRPHAWRRAAPFIWMVGGSEFYVRPEGDGLLASPCDASPAEPGVPAVDPSAAVRLGEKLLAAAPDIGDLEVRRTWACLRTFAADRRPIIGADPALPGLYYVAGLGGAGVTVSGAVGELATSLIGRRTPTWIDAALLGANRPGAWDTAPSTGD